MFDNKMKYVVFNQADIVIFPLHVNHRDIKLLAEKPTSAGFVEFWFNGEDVVYHISGKSDSLGLEPDYEIDDMLIMMLTRFIPSKGRE